VAGGVSLARERGARDVHAVTETAEAFFRRLGFERIGARDDLPGPIRQTPMVRHACDVSAAALRRSVAA
jgi:N-acetylglutamate synthase-like GNAT family acetyltransferase